MQTRRSLDGGSLPKHMSNAAGADWDWQDEARCKKNTHGLPGHAWLVDAKDRVKKGDTPPKEWIKMALIICASCPAQYDCARFALTVEEKWGTWGMRVEDLRALHRHGGGVAIVDAAEDMGMPVQAAVRAVLVRSATVA